MPKEETIELIKLNNALIVKTGATDTIGNLACTTVIDTVNFTEANNYWDDQVIILLDGDNKGLARKIDSSDQATGTITVTKAFPYQVLNGISYKILSQIVVDYIANASFGNNTFTLLNGTTEQNVFLDYDGTAKIYFRIDLSNITKDIIIREYEQVDETNYRQLTAKTFPSDFDSGTKAVDITFISIDDCKYKITLQSPTAEGANRTVPYSYRLETLG